MFSCKSLLLIAIVLLVAVVILLSFILFGNGTSTAADKNAPVPCSVREAKKYLAAIKTLLQDNRDALVACDGKQNDAAQTLIAQGEYAVYIAEKKEDALETPKTRLLLENTATYLTQAIPALLANEDLPEEKGTRLRAYVSPIDGTVQTYSVSVPDIYDPSLKWPLIVSMHGHGWYGPYQGHPAPAYAGAICLSPQGRGATDYRDLGEEDVMEAIRRVKNEFAIDDNRVYLTGGSMGGTGAFYLGAHYADQFAAIFPIVGNADNSAWTLRWKWNADFQRRNAALRDAIQLTHSVTPFAQNFLNLPTYVLAGSADTVVPPEHSRKLVAQLRVLGANVEYREYPNSGHGNFPADASQAGMAWACSWERNPYPTRVTWKTALLKHGKAYWTRIDQLTAPLTCGTIDAQVINDTTLDIRTENLLAFSIQKTPQLFSAQATVTASIDGMNVAFSFDAIPSDGWISFRRHPDTQRWMLAKDAPIPALTKHDRLEGPIQEMLNAPFILVIGTANEAMVEAWQTEADTFAYEWKRRNGAEPRIIKDTELTPDMEKTYNLLLLGGARDNAVSARFLPNTPYGDLQKILQNHYQTQDAALLAKPDLGAFVLFPTESRLATVIDANSPQAAYQAWGRFGNWFNWGVYDSKKYFDFAFFDNRSCSPETMLLLGYFGTDWSLNNAWYTFGDTKLRQDTPELLYPPMAIPDSNATDLELASIRPKTIDQMRGAVAFGRSFFGEPLPQEAGQSSSNSIGLRAPATLTYQLDGTFKTLTSTVTLLNARESGICLSREKHEKVTFQICNGDEVLAEASVTWEEPVATISADISNVSELTLKTIPSGGPSWLHNGAAWINPMLNK